MGGSAAKTVSGSFSQGKDLLRASTRRMLSRQLSIIHTVRQVAVETQTLQYEKDRSKQRRQLSGLILFLLSYLLLGGLIFTLSEGWDYATGIYFATVTMSTVGYGDIVPSTAGMRSVAVLYGLVGMTFISSKILTVMATLRELAVANVQISTMKSTSKSMKDLDVGWCKWIRGPLYLGIYFAGQLAMAGIYVGVAGEGVLVLDEDGLETGELSRLDIGNAFWHACTTAMTIGYGDFAARVRTRSNTLPLPVLSSSLSSAAHSILSIHSQLPVTPSMRVFTTVHIVLSCFSLMLIVANLQRASMRELQNQRQKKLLEARIDGDLIPKLVRLNMP